MKFSNVYIVTLPAEWWNLSIFLGGKWKFPHEYLNRLANFFFLQSFHSAGKFRCGFTRHQDDPEVVQKATSTNLDVVLEVRING